MRNTYNFVFTERLILLRNLAILISIFLTGCNPAPLTPVSLTATPSTTPAVIPPTETTTPAMAEATATLKIETVSPPAGLLYYSNNGIWLVGSGYTPLLLIEATEYTIVQLSPDGKKVLIREPGEIE